MRDQREIMPDTISIFSENMYLEKKMTKVFVYIYHDDVIFKEVFPIKDDCFIGTLYTSCKSCFCLLMEI